MKTALIIIGVVVLVLGAAAAGFYGGMQYQSSQVNQARLNFEQVRGQIPSGGFPGDAQGFPGAAQGNFGGNRPSNQVLGSRGGVMGQVKTVDGNELTISTAEDVTTVNLSDTTRIQMNTQVPVSELQPGMRVMVTGEKDSSGNISANQIMILDENATFMAYPPPAAGTEP